MKKLIIAAFAVAFAAIAQAASINWTISNVYSSSDSTVKGDGYAALLFLTQNTTNVSGLTLTTLAEVTSAIGATDWTTTVSNLASANANLNANGGILTAPTGISSDFASGTVGGFAIIFDASAIASATHYYLVSAGDVKTVTFTSSTGGKTMSFGTQADPSRAQGAWTEIGSIPEPTSGLLLLIGMAGLALKRKQA